MKDDTYLSPYKHSGSRPTLADASRSGSENDSLLDLYGHPISTAGTMERRERTPPQPALPQADTLFTLEDEDPERSRWIHRDKLALIESHELQEAGIKLPRNSSLRGRSGSKSKGRKSHSRGASRDLPIAGRHEQEREVLPAREGRRQRDESPQKQQQEQIEATSTDMAEFDLRTPEEVASDPYSSPMYRQQGLRSSSSRIPLPKSSPMPIPQEHRERHTPLPRTRGASGTWASGDEDRIGYNKLRRRSQSVGSQVLLDDGEPLNFNGTPNKVTNDSNTPSPYTSPSKQRIGETKVASSNNARKASAALRNVSEPQKSRATSTTPGASPANRPKSRSGLEPRPATAVKRPEGEAPWIADMYKPDPRLPPDQQLIPTHAKRLQQKQLGQQTKVDASTPPPKRDFDPLAVHTQNGLQPPSPSIARSPRDLNEKSPAENQAGWPLNVSPKESVTISGSPNGNGGGNSPGAASDHAGYSTIPKVKNTPPTGSAPTLKPDQQPMRREMEQKVKEKEKEKGCGCCVVM